MIKDFVIRRAADARERRTFEVEEGQIKSFRVQLEVRAADAWKPVIRWDTSHGFVDCDRYNLKGEKTKSILNVSAEEGLTLAQSDLNTKWQEYRRRFLEGRMP